MQGDQVLLAGVLPRLHQPLCVHRHSFRLFFLQVKGPAYGQDLEADSSDEALGSSPDPKGEEALVAISKSVRRAREGLTELLKQLSAATAAEAEALAGSGSNSNGESGSGGEASSEYEARGGPEGRDHLRGWEGWCECVGP